MSGIDKLKEVDWRGLYKKASNKVKQYTLNLSPLELKVEDATNMETWGPHGSAMSEISDACFDPEGYRQVLGVIARRLQERDEHWRMCYKALLLLEFLCKHGPTKIAQDVAASMSVMERLQNFHYKDENGRDHGTNVRHRAKEIVDLVTNPDRLREEREKAKQNRDKYRGVSRDDMRMGGFGGGSSSYDSYGSSSRRFDPASLARPGGPPTTGSQYGSGTYGSYGRNVSPMTGFGGGTAAAQYGGSGGGGSQRYDRYDDPDDYDTGHQVSPRASSKGGGAGLGSELTHGRDDKAHTDAVNATKARIEKLKLSGATSSSHGDSRAGEEADKKKKLTDVKVNPKIAASLGLKLPPNPPAVAQKTSTGGAAAVGEIDLLGGLMDDEDTQPAVNGGGVAAEPSFAAFADELTNTGTSTTAAGGETGWDAFGGGGTNNTTNTTGANTASANEPLDLFAALEAPNASTSATNTTAAADAFDPFTELTGAHQAAAATQPAVLDMFGGGVSTAPPPSSLLSTSPLGPSMAAPVSPTFGNFSANNSGGFPTTTSPGGTTTSVKSPKAASGQTGSRPSTPEDAFAALTGLSKPTAAPMGERKGLGVQPPPLSPTAGGSGVASPSAAAGFDSTNGFAAFSAATTSSLSPPSMGAGMMSSAAPAQAAAGNQSSKDPFEGLF